MIPSVSDSELELMKIIWSAGGKSLYATIMERLSETGNHWQKNTVITLLSRLVEKGLLKTNKIGRRNEYAALVSQADYQAAQTRRFLNKFYEGDARGLVSTLICGEMLSEEEYKELRRFWETGQEDGSK